MIAFPDELLRIIFSFVGPRTLCRLSCVSKKVRSLADEDDVWKILGFHKMQMKQLFEMAQRDVLFVALQEGLARDALRRAETELLHKSIRMCETRFDTVGQLTTQKWMGRMGGWFTSRDSAIQTWSDWPYLRNQVGVDRYAGEVEVQKRRLETYTDYLVNLERRLVA